MVWREPTNHVTDCYFCMVPPVSGGITKKKKSAIAYPNIFAAIRPVPHGESLPVTDPPTAFSMDPSNDEDEDEQASAILGFSAFYYIDQDSDSDFCEGASSAPHRITQEELNDLVRDLELSKNKAELLESRLQQWNLSR